jgi:ribosome-associated heat shock protein Hsp15
VEGARQGRSWRPCWREAIILGGKDFRLSEALEVHQATETCRVDVWLWRARFFKTRSLAARIVEEGGIRLSRGGARTPLDKPSRGVRRGDVLSFAQGPRWLAVKVEALGARRGPAAKARALYSILDHAGHIP